VGTGDELQTIDLIELRRDLVSKQPSSTTWRNSPSLNVLRITPDQITESTLVRDLLGTGNDTNLIKSTNLWAETTVNAKDSSVNNSRKNEEVKDLAASLPDGSIAVLLLALLVEAINLSNLAGLVVAADKSDAIWVPAHN